MCDIFHLLIVNIVNRVLETKVAAQFKPDNANEYAFYVADFEYEGVYYRIEMENIESNYLDHFIRKLLEP